MPTLMPVPQSDRLRQSTSDRSQSKISLVEVKPRALEPAVTPIEAVDALALCMLSGCAGG